MKHSLELAGQNLLDCLCPPLGYLPYFYLNVDCDYRAEYRHMQAGHNIGRWWDAMLRLEAATGFLIPAHLEAAMLGNAQRFYAPENLHFGFPVIRPWDIPRVDTHSVREMFLALTALVRYRNSRWAAQQGHVMMEALRQLFRADGSWDLEQVERSYHPEEIRYHPEDISRYNINTDPASWVHPTENWNIDPTFTFGRWIEPLVLFYQATRDSMALELADLLSRYHLAHTTNPDGELNPGYTPVHTHAYLNNLRGLLLFGELTNQREIIETVAATYRTTIPRHVKRSGFTAHNWGTDRGPETASAGDAAQLALWLSRHGYTEFLDDAERLVRARLLPCQITESPGLRPVLDDGQDEHLHLDARLVGALGGCPRQPHAAKSATTDVTAAVLHSLIDIYQHIAVRTDAGLTVNFHLEYEDEAIRVASDRGQEAQVTIQPKVAENILIRVPGWTPPESVRLAVNGKHIATVMLGNLAYVSRDLLPGVIVLTYALPPSTVIERTDGIDYEFAWRGDDIMGVWPNSDFMPFYPTMPGRG
ncbi:MAG: hypothetical protein ACYC4R_05490 [Anaerolineae bacterium]